MNKLEQLKLNTKINVSNQDMEQSFKILPSKYEDLRKYESKPGKFCGIHELQDLIKWKKGFSYLFTGTPGVGKSTMVLYLYLLMAFKYGYKFGIWSPEMEDSELEKKGIFHHVKDILFTLIWTLSGKTPYEFYAKKHGTIQMNEDEIRSLQNWVEDHFKFVHLYNRTPSGIIEAFTKVHETFGVDGYLIDPWKSVKQNMGSVRADIWLEDILMSFKEFSLETDSIMCFIVHPKTLKDYTDQDGNFRLITPWDLNGGAAWYNSMDIIISLRKLEFNTEWYTWKVRKQHLAGSTGQFLDINFDMDSYRFKFGGNDPFSARF